MGSLETEDILGPDLSQWMHMHPLHPARLHLGPPQASASEAGHHGFVRGRGITYKVSVLVVTRAG